MHRHNRCGVTPSHAFDAGQSPGHETGLDALQAYYAADMALRGSRKVMIDASPEQILDALADVETMPSWSPLHVRAEVVDFYPDGRPHCVKAVAKFMHVVDRQVLEYTWGPDWVVWDAAATSCTQALHGEYKLQPQAGMTEVRFDITFEPVGVRTTLVTRWAKAHVLEGFTEGLRRRVTG